MDYRRLLPIGSVCIGFLLVYHHVIYKMAIHWYKDDNYSHGFLIPFISGYLIWRSRERLSQLPVAPSNVGFVLLIASFAFFIITHIGAELFTMRFSMIPVILSAVVFLMGWRFAKELLLPIAFLMFMIPLPAIIWNKIAFPLKLFATKSAVAIIQLVNIPVYREGNIIHLANTTLEVVDACSGLRSLTSLLALSAAFSLLSRLSKTRKLMLFLSAVPIAIAVNIFRLSVTAILARYFGERAAQGFLHDISGMIIFILALILVFAVYWSLDRVFTNRGQTHGNE